MTIKEAPTGDVADPLLREAVLLAELAALQSRIEGWARSHNLWFDAGFSIPFVHRNEAPREYETLRLWYEGPLNRVFAGDYETDGVDFEKEFRLLVESCGFEYECEDHVSLSLFPEREARRRDYLKLHRWQWVQQLTEKRLYDLHAEVFAHFADDPDALKQLHWRQFEEFLDSVFRNQGFRTELGPGSNDGGVDIRLYQSEAIPEIVTVVQAKRYASQPIGFDAVAALAMTAQLEHAPYALFATTSRYQPRARNFAATTRGRLDLPCVQLTGPPEFREWCREISKQLTAYFATGDQTLPPILRNTARTELTGRIVVAQYGCGIIMNSFCLIEADFPHEAILRPIGARKVSGDGQRGTEVPNIGDPVQLLETERFLAFKERRADGRYTFWGNRKLFSLWSGAPESFDLLD